MRHSVADVTRFGVVVAQFIGDFTRYLISEMTAGCGSWLCVGEGCGIKREHSRAGVPVVHSELRSLLNAEAVQAWNAWTVFACELNTHVATLLQLD